MERSKKIYDLFENAFFGINVMDKSIINLYCNRYDYLKTFLDYHNSIEPLKCFIEEHNSWEEEKEKIYNELDELYEKIISVINY